MNFTLTISASPELQAVLEKLAGNAAATPAASPEVKPGKEKAPKPTPPVVVTPPVVEDDMGLGEDAPALTAEQIRQLGKDKAKEIGPPKVKELITSMGFPNIAAITEDKFAEFAEKLAKLTK